MRRLPRNNSATGTSVASAPLRRKERPVPKNRFFTELLRDGGGSARALAFQIIFGSDVDLVPVESVMLVESGVLGGNDSVLEIGRDFPERNEFVAFVIWRAVNPGLQAALDMHRSGWRVDPAGGQKCQRGQAPKKHKADDEP